MKKLFSEQPVFLVLLPLFYLFSTLYAYYPVLVAADVFHPAALLLIGIPAVLFLVFRVLLKEQKKYALLVLYLFVTYLFFGSLLAFSKHYLPVLGRYKVLVPVLLACAVVIFVLLYRSKRTFGSLFLYLNTLLAVFVVMEVVRCSVRNSIILSTLMTADIQKDPAFKTAICDTCSKPDIYYIVFDGYSASRTLKEYWNYDNSELEAFLQREGFFLARQSTSNYNFTPYSISSTLNMDFHRTSASSVNVAEFCKGVATMRPSIVFELLRANKYQLINQSFFPVSLEKPALGISFIGQKKRMLLSQTFTIRAMADIGWQFDVLPELNTAVDKIERARIQRAQILSAYDSLKAVSARRNSGPQFVYTHFLTPHDPNLFDSAGNFTHESQWTYSKRSDADYLAQLKYINTLIKDIVARLRTEGSRPRVIILQSDHGYRSFQDPAFFPKEFNNLFAIYYPDRDYSQLYDSVSNVNTFPLIFNKYFHASIPLRKDSSVYIPH